MMKKFLRNFSAIAKSSVICNTKIKFLGTNGWYSTKTGDTPCVAVFAKDRLIVFDAGNGFSKIKEECVRTGVRKIDVFLSHLHLDHVEGLHTLPRIPAGCEVRIFVPTAAYKKMLEALLDHPYTAHLSQNNCSVKIIEFKRASAGLPYKISMLPLRHADPCFGYRLGIGGKTIAYCTDTGPCRNFQKLATGADLLISECSMLPGTKIYHSWPHLNPETAARLAKKSGAKRLALAHFDPSRYGSMASRQKALTVAKKIFKKTFAAKDGLVISV
jgi:ribonuclease BN (tRNA processing enzyme)